MRDPLRDAYEGARTVKSAVSDRLLFALKPRGTEPPFATPCGDEIPEPTT